MLNSASVASGSGKEIETCHSIKRRGTWWIDVTTPPPASALERSAALRPRPGAGTARQAESTVVAGPSPGGKNRAIHGTRRVTSFCSRLSTRRRTIRTRRSCAGLPAVPAGQAAGGDRSELIGRIGQIKAERSSPANANRTLALIPRDSAQGGAGVGMDRQGAEDPLYKEAKRRVRWSSRRKKISKRHYLRSCAAKYQLRTLAYALWIHQSQIYLFNSSQSKRIGYIFVLLGRKKRMVSQGQMSHRSHYASETPTRSRCTSCTA